jgi:hypothetical protein
MIPTNTAAGRHKNKTHSTSSAGTVTIAHGSCFLQSRTLSGLTVHHLLTSRDPLPWSTDNRERPSDKGSHGDIQPHLDSMVSRVVCTSANVATQCLADRPIQQSGCWLVHGHSNCKLNHDSCSIHRQPLVLTQKMICIAKKTLRCSTLNQMTEDSHRRVGFFDSSTSSSCTPAGTCVAIAFLMPTHCIRGGLYGRELTTCSRSGSNLWRCMEQPAHCIPD